jgi:hypothetical protein
MRYRVRLFICLSLALIVVLIGACQSPLANVPATAPALPATAPAPILPTHTLPPTQTPLPSPTATPTLTPTPLQTNTQTPTPTTTATPTLIPPTATSTSTWTPTPTPPPPTPTPTPIPPTVTRAPTATPSPRPPAPSPSPYRFLPAGPVQADPSHPCPACPRAPAYIVGHVLDASGNPLAGVRLVCYNEWHRYPVVASKGGGEYDFPIIQADTTWYLVVLDQTDTPISPEVPVTIRLAESCRYILDWQRLD